jgi:hypothetical protein
VTVSEPPIVIAAGDTSSHSVAADKWTPNSGGSEQLVFLGPGAPQLPAQPFSCR